jgi:hypothetical protein
MTREEIERSFVEAGWELDGSFSGHLVVGEDTDLSILAHKQAWGAKEPIFELCDDEGNLTYWVKAIPTPREAKELLEEHGKPFEEELDHSYEKGA